MLKLVTVLIMNNFIYILITLQNVQQAQALAIYLDRLAGKMHQNQIHH